MCQKIVSFLRLVLHELHKFLRKHSWLPNVASYLKFTSSLPHWFHNIPNVLLPLHLRYDPADWAVSSQRHSIHISPSLSLYSYPTHASYYKWIYIKFKKDFVHQHGLPLITTPCQPFFNVHDMHLIKTLSIDTILNIWIKFSHSSQRYY